MQSYKEFLGSKPQTSHDAAGTGMCVDAFVKLGLLSGPYDPRLNHHCASAKKIARLLNEALTKRQSWLPNVIETEDAMRTMGSQYSP